MAGAPIRRHRLIASRTPGRDLPGPAAEKRVKPAAGLSVADRATLADLLGRIVFDKNVPVVIDSPPTNTQPKNTSASA